jgi:ATP-dependent Clp protease ATP-binding subunit ClpC
MKFDYFSPQLVEVLRNAHKKAADLNFEDVGTDHLLFALSELNGFFEKFDLEKTTIQHELHTLLGRSDYMKEPHTYTQRANNAIKNALTEIDHINQLYVKPEHLLLSLAKQENGVAIKVFENLGVDIDTLKKKVESLLTVS